MYVKWDDWNNNASNYYRNNNHSITYPTHINSLIHFWAKKIRTPITAFLFPTHNNLKSKILDCFPINHYTRLSTKSSLLKAT